MAADQDPRLAFPSIEAMVAGREEDFERIARTIDPTDREGIELRATGLAEQLWRAAARDMAKNIEAAGIAPPDACRNLAENLPMEEPGRRQLIRAIVARIDAYLQR